MSLNCHRIVNPEIIVRYAGFEASLIHLMREGWKVMIRDDFDHHSYPGYQLENKYLQLILSGPGVRLITKVTTVYIPDISYSDRHYVTVEDMYRKKGVIHVDAFAATRIEMIRAMSFGVINWSADAFRPIDSDILPRTVECDHLDLWNLPLFDTIISPPSEIIIDPKEIGFWLDKINEAQQPRQKEIRDRMLKEKRMSDHKAKIHAQLLTIE